MHNLNHESHTFVGERGYMIQKGDKIAQAIHVPILLSEAVVTETLPKTVRGSGGFGSTGS
jgi:dUTP pyrophosphatase